MDNRFYEHRIFQLEQQVAFLFRHLGIDPAPTGGQLPPSLYAAISSGHKLDAIKIYREVTGASLAQAKIAVEEIQRQAQSAW